MAVMRPSRTWRRLMPQNATVVEYNESLESCGVDVPRLAAVKKYRKHSSNESYMHHFSKHFNLSTAMVRVPAAEDAPLLRSSPTVLYPPAGYDTLESSFDA